MYECVSNYDIWADFWMIASIVVFCAILGICIWYFVVQ